MAPAPAPPALSLSDGRWHVLLTCPTGAAHLEQGRPCQDACLALQQFYKGVPCTVLAVADGHGGSRYTRSEIGAHLAMDAVRDTVSQLLLSLDGLDDPSPEAAAKALAHHFRTYFVKDLLRAWRQRAIDHARAHPGDGLEPESESSIARYGATVALCVIHDQRVLAGALGDSVIYLVRDSAEGIAVEPVFPRADDGVGLGTASLSGAAAAYAWEASLRTLAPGDPALLLLTTDGLSDSLRDPAASVRDLYLKTRERGMDWLRRVLPGQLRDWSARGVGDDMGTIVFFLESAEIAASVSEQPTEEPA